MIELSGDFLQRKPENAIIIDSVNLYLSVNDDYMENLRDNFTEKEITKDGE